MTAHHQAEQRARRHLMQPSMAATNAILLTTHVLFCPGQQPTSHRADLANIHNLLGRSINKLLVIDCPSLHLFL